MRSYISNQKQLQHFEFTKNVFVLFFLVCIYCDFYQLSLLIQIQIYSYSIATFGNILDFFHGHQIFSIFIPTLKTQLRKSVN